MADCSHACALGLILMIATTACPAEPRDARFDPATGRVRLLYIGDAIGVPNPFPILNNEPLLSCNAVYACTAHQPVDVIKKSIRSYMPRTYARFVNNDVVILSDANRDGFRADHFRWMKDGVIEEGLGLVMIGGAESFAQEGGYPSWQPTEVADVLPCDMIPTPPRFSGGWIRVTDWDDEFIKSLPFKTLGSYGVFSGSNNILPRTNARCIADLVHTTLGSAPFLMWWDLGKGRTMAQSADWTPAGGNVFMRWRYYGDYAINMVLFLAGHKLPDDLDLVYLVRRRMRETNDALSSLHSMVDIVEKFGGSATQVTKMIAEIQNVKGSGIGHYVGGELDEALETFGTALKMCDDAMRAALKARDAAAFWIFATEWCAVAGTSMLAASVLWLLMIKRRLYREVALTRLGPTKDQP